MNYYKLLAYIFAVCFCAHSWACFPLKTRAEALSTEELNAVEKLACLEPYGVKSKKHFIYSDSSNKNGEIFADLTCDSNKIFQGSPIVNSVSCTRKSTNWQCPERKENVQIQLNGRSVKLELTNVSPSLAYQTLNKINKYWFQAQSIEKAIGSYCKASLSENKEEIKLACETKIIRVQIKCPTTDCPRVLWLDNYEQSMCN